MIFHEGLHIRYTITKAEQEVYKILEGLFHIITEKFKPLHNRITVSLHIFFKLNKQCVETAEECISTLRIKAAVFKYKESDSHLKEHFIKRPKEFSMTVQIIKRVNSIQ